MFVQNAPIIGCHVTKFLLCKTKQSGTNKSFYVHFCVTTKNKPIKLGIDLNSVPGGVVLLH